MFFCCLGARVVLSRWWHVAPPSPSPVKSGMDFLEVLRQATRPEWSSFLKLHWSKQTTVEPEDFPLARGHRICVSRPMKSAICGTVLYWCWSGGRGADPPAGGTHCVDYPMAPRRDLLVAITGCPFFVLFSSDSCPDGFRDRSGTKLDLSSESESLSSC